VSEIKAKLGELLPSEAALQHLLTVPVSVRLGYDISKIFGLVWNETEIFRSRHNALVKELGAAREPTPEEAAAGQKMILTVTPENQKQFEERLEAVGNELKDIEVTIPWAPLRLEAFEKLTASEADICGPYKTYGRLFVALGSLVSEEAEDGR
jgi:hypothetical protein